MLRTTESRGFLSIYKYVGIILLILLDSRLRGNDEEKIWT
jgi:hypothetical protein